MSLFYIVDNFEACKAKFENNRKRMAQQMTLNTVMERGRKTVKLSTVFEKANNSEALDSEVDVSDNGVSDTDLNEI